MGLSALITAAGASCGNGPIADLPDLMVVTKQPLQILPSKADWIFRHQTCNVRANGGKIRYMLHDLCIKRTYAA
jgi:hypothetical protein